MAALHFVDNNWFERRAKRRRVWRPQDAHDEGYAGSQQESSDFSVFLDSLKPEEAPVVAEQQSKALVEVTDQRNTAAETHIMASERSIKRRKPVAMESSRSPRPPTANDYGEVQGYDNDAWYMGRISAWHKPASPNAVAGSSSSHTRETPLVTSSKRPGKEGNGSKIREGALIDASSISSPSATPLQLPSASPPRALRQRPTLASEQKANRTRKAERDAAAALKKKEEEEERKMTPTEYAKRVQTKFADFLAKTDEAKLLLKGKAIFYVGGDFDKATKNTRTKMDFLRKKGASVVPTYDPDKVTHIITETSAKATVHACGLKALDEIPMNIPTVTWDWVNKQFPMEFLCAAFSSRIDASPDYFEKKNKLGQKRTRVRPMRPEDEDYSRIEDFSVSEHGPAKRLKPARVCAEVSSSNPPPPPVKSDNYKALQAQSVLADSVDPLAEFYTKARKDAEEGRNIDSGDESEEERIAIAKTSKFTCDNTPAAGGKCINQDIVDKLSELLEINKTKQGGDPKEQKWRVFSYSKAIRAIRNHKKRIRTLEDAMQINGVGEKTARKIKEIVDTGELRRIEIDNTEDVRSIKLFYGIYGVGISTAQKWYANGLRTLEDLREGKAGVKLTDVQAMGLKHYDDINTRIPRMEVFEIFQMIRKIALKLDPKLFIEVMGSYRRGKSTCGDIDILLTRSTHDGRTHRGTLKILLRELHMSGIVTADLAIPEDFNDLKQTYRGLCRRDEKSPHRRIDILCVPFEERGGALLYYTGDDIFNRAIRYKAKKMGYSLSQHGLSTKVVRDIRGKKLVSGELIASETEEEIFRLLGVPWQEPHERVRNL